MHHQRRLPFALVLVGTLVAALVVPSGARGALVAEYAADGSESVVDGVSHDWGSSQTDTATQHINVLRMAHDAPSVDLELGLPFDRANARQKTTLEALNATTPTHRVVAAVNGDFWQTSDSGAYAPAGLDITDGELVAARADGDRAALGRRADGSLLIGTPAVALTVTLPGDVDVSATGVNRIRAADELVVYTPRFGPSTATDATGIEVRLTGAQLPMTSTGTYSTTVAEIRPDAGDTPISATDLVLSATGTAAASLQNLQVGDAVTVQTAIDDGWQDVDTAVGGTLLFQGDETPDFSDPKYQFANPRTAAGIDASGNLLLVTVDGRSETSGGLLMTDLVALMRSMGAVDAINLDGGGSTTMVVDPAGDTPLEVVNKPSQHYERRVNTSVQIVSRAVDSGPSVSAPGAHIVPSVTAGKTDAAVQLSWTSSAPGSVLSTELQRLGRDGEWHDIALDDPRAITITQRFKFGKNNRFRVRVTDDHGATSDWATSPVYVLNRYNESSAEIVRAGPWKVRSASSAMGGHFARSTYDGSSHILSMNESGIQVAAVVQLSRTAGIAQVTIGTTSALIDTHASSTQPRWVLFVGSGDSISVANAASSAHPNVDVDAFLVLTTK